MPRINDEIYGTFEFNEPLLTDLYNCRPVQRLQHIHQAGASYLVKSGRGGNRLEHSLGVMYLIRMLGGTVEEQAAGLLHDISHTAFSHVIDQVFDNRDETFHEAHKDWLASSSGISDILEKHGCSLHHILDDHAWKILEQPQPDLCADRIDYTLRDLFAYGLITKDEIRFFLDNLSFRDNRVGLSNAEAARWFAYQYYREVTELFMNPLEIYANNFLASVLKQAYLQGIITVEDMLTDTDDEILSKIKLSGDQDLLGGLKVLQPGLEVSIDDEAFEFKGYAKPRYVDPLVFISTNTRRLSETDDEVFLMRDEIRKRAGHGIHVKRQAAMAAK